MLRRLVGSQAETESPERRWAWEGPWEHVDGSVLGLAQLFKIAERFVGPCEIANERIAHRM